MSVEIVGVGAGGDTCGASLNISLLIRIVVMNSWKK